MTSPSRAQLPEVLHEAADESFDTFLSREAPLDPNPNRWAAL